ncbi:MAG: hypothetical protein ACRDL5_16670 [Solirubrobacteraceae bacterium]
MTNRATNLFPHLTAAQNVVEVGRPDEPLDHPLPERTRAFLSKMLH